MNIAENLMELFILDEAVLSKTKTKIPMAKMKVLCLLHVNGVLSAKEIISKTGIIKSNMALICKELLKRKLIESRQNFNDKRSVLYKITPEGEVLVRNFFMEINKGFINNENDKILLNSIKYLSNILNKKV